MEFALDCHLTMNAHVSNIARTCYSELHCLTSIRILIRILINHDCLPILMLLYTMLYIVLAYLMLFAALTNSVCLNNASFFFLLKYFLCQGYELSGEIALKNNHYYYYYYYYIPDKHCKCHSWNCYWFVKN